MHINMKRLQIHGLWLVLQIISTTQENATLSNVNYVTSKLILLPTASVLKSLDKQTILVHKSCSIVMEESYTITATLQSSEISKSGSFVSTLTPQRTRTQSVRNLCNGTQSKSVRNIFTNTQTRSIDLQTIFTTGSMLIVRPNRTYAGSRKTKTYELNPSTGSTAGLQNSTIKVTGSSEIERYSTGNRFSSANISQTVPRKSSTVHRVYTSVLQSSTESESRNLVPSSSTIESRVEFTAAESSSVLQSSTESESRNLVPSSSTIESRVEFTSAESSSVLQSFTESESRNLVPSSSTIESRVKFTAAESSRSYHTLESSSNYRFLSIRSTTQTSQLSRIINVSLSRPSISGTEKLKTRVSTTNYADRNQSSHTSSAHRSSTLEGLKTSKTLHTVYATSTYRGSEISQFSRHGNNSYLTHTVYLSSTTTVNKDSRIKPTNVMTIFASVSQTSANKESINTQRQTSSQKMILETLSSSEDSLSTSYSVVSVLSSSVLETKGSSYRSSINSSSKVLNHNSQEISSSERPPTTITTHSSGGRTGMPLYVLAICLPLAALLGFTLACVYFKRNKEDQRVRYSVTVEVSAENPNHEMKRMYSVIDMTAGITKDVLSGLESRKTSNEILDQSDSGSLSITQQDQDQNV